MYSGQHGPPFAAAWLAGYRQAQLARMERITGWVRRELARLPEPADDRAFLVYRTMADPRWVDPTIEPNERVPNTCVLGDPRRANYLPAGLARSTTLRSWLSQWSVADSHADAVRHAARSSVPFLVLMHGADEGCPPSHPRAIFAAVPHAAKHLVEIPGANHYYAGQPAKLAQAADAIRAWLVDHHLL